MSDPIVPPKPGAADLLEIYYEPRAVFERRRGGQFGLPLIVLAVIAAVVYNATADSAQPLIDAEVARSMAKTPGVTPEQIATGKAAAGMIQRFAIPLVFLIGPLLGGLIMWVVALLPKIKVPVAVAITIATFSWYPHLIELVLGGLQAAFITVESPSRYSYSIGPARFVDFAQSPILVAILGRLDLFTIWSTILVALGLQVAAGATKSQAWTVASLMWLLGTLPGLIAALVA